ncbi:MAG: hypothetical protein RMJ98_19870 [Myxococcales bacterium]|nr:hypothetical protein [Polyangiaceae bacterium]MDW8251559.1 hypothetical protein [Myxococcales bacterium]
MPLPLPAPWSLVALARRLGGSLDEDIRSCEILSLASPEDTPEPFSLVPVFRSRWVRQALSGDGYFLTNPSLASRLPVGRRWIHPEPQTVLTTLLSEAFPCTEAPDERHRAYLDPAARIAVTARIAPGVVVRAGAEVGEEVILEPNVVILGGVILERRVRVGAGSVLGRSGFGWLPGGATSVRMPHPGGVVVEEGAEIGALCTVDAGVLIPTRIGRGARLDSHVHVGHNVRIGAGVHVAAQSGFAGSVVVGAGVLVGGQVGVADHVHVGAGARLAAKSGVIGDIPPGATVAGYPAIEHRRWLRALARLFRTPP